MRGEVVAGIGSVIVTISGWLIAQAELPSMPSSINGLITQVGGLGLAVWLVYHHTTVTIPNMQKLHAEERTASQRGFERVLDEKRAEYFKELQTQRDQFSAMLDKMNCKYRIDA
jgi:hypothetical protein